MAKFNQTSRPERDTKASQDGSRPIFFWFRPCLHEQMKRLYMEIRKVVCHAELKFDQIRYLLIEIWNENIKWMQLTSIKETRQEKGRI